MEKELKEKIREDIGEITFLMKLKCLYYIPVVIARYHIGDLFPFAIAPDWMVKLFTYVDKIKHGDEDKEFVEVITKLAKRERSLRERRQNILSAIKGGPR